MRTQLVVGLILALVLTGTVGYTSYVLPNVGGEPYVELKVMARLGPGEPPAPTSYVLGANIDWTDDCQGLYDPVSGLLRPVPVGELISVGPTYLRFPSTDLSQHYNWTRGVGKVNERGSNPSHGKYPQTTTFGTDEFHTLINHTGATAVIVVNGASGNAREAADWVSYCNDVYWKGKGVLRQQNGHSQPYGVRYWEVGTEMDSTSVWQSGADQTTPAGTQYARRLMEYSRAMKAVDPTVKVGAWLVLSSDMESASADPSWNINVLTEAGGTFPLTVGGRVQTLRFFDYVVVSIHLPRVEVLLEAKDLFSYSYASVEDALATDLDQLRGLLLANEVPIAIASFEPDFTSGGWNTQTAADAGAAAITADIAAEAVARSVTSEGRRVLYACYGELSARSFSSLLVNPDFKEARLESWQRSPSYYAMRMCTELQGTRPLPIAELRMPKYSVGGERQLAKIEDVPVVSSFAGSDSNGTVIRVLLVNREVGHSTRVRLTIDGWGGQMSVSRTVISAESLLSNNLLEERVRTTTEAWRAGGSSLEVVVPPGSVVLMELGRSGGG